MMIKTGLQNKVVLITGANHGIGAATAKALATEGASILINYLRLPPMQRYSQSEQNLDIYDTMRAKSADEVLQAIRANEGQAEAVEADLSDVMNIPMLFDRAEALFGTVDILINNADHCEQNTFIPTSQSGSTVIAPDGYPSISITAESNDRQFAVNSRAVALMMAEYARRHIVHLKNWGRIINISTDGAPAFPGTISYGASKYAAESYTRAAAIELGKYGITVNIVSPGPIQTGWIRPDLEAQIIAETPLGRVGQPEDVADVIVFLASEQGRWVSGQMISVSGGRRML
jgi:3-oxoacyl-[acyl-carrier protein] reductase